MKLKYPEGCDYEKGIPDDCREEKLKDDFINCTDYNKLTECIKFFLNNSLDNLKIENGTTPVNTYIGEVTRKAKLFRLDWVTSVMSTNGKLTDDEELFIAKYINANNADGIRRIANFISKENFSKIFISEDDKKKFPYYPEWIFEAAPEEYYLNETIKISPKIGYGGAIVKNPKVLSKMKRDKARSIRFERLDYSEDFFKFLLNKRIGLRSIEYFLLQDLELVKKYFKKLLNTSNMYKLPTKTSTIDRKNIRARFKLRVLRRQISNLAKLVNDHKYYLIKERITPESLLEIWDLVNKEFNNLSKSIYFERPDDELIREEKFQLFISLSEIYCKLLNQYKGKTKLLEYLEKIINLAKKENFNVICETSTLERLLLWDRWTPKRQKNNKEIVDKLIENKLFGNHFQLFFDIVYTPEMIGVATNTLKYLTNNGIFTEVSPTTIRWLYKNGTILSNMDFKKLTDYFQRGEINIGDDVQSKILRCIIRHGEKGYFPLISREVYDDNIFLIKHIFRSLSAGDVTSFLVMSEYDFTEDEIEELYSFITYNVKYELFTNNTINSETLKLRWEIEKMEKEKEINPKYEEDNAVDDA